MNLSDKITKITAITTIKIVTSGYYDRYIKQDTEYVVDFKMSDDGIPLEVKFDLKNKLHDFVFEFSGGTTEIDYDKLVIECTDMIAQINTITERVTYISGNVNPSMSTTIKLSFDDYKSIDSYLHLYTGTPENYTSDHIAKCKNHLESNPLSPHLLAVVKNQITDCDERNNKLAKFFAEKNN
jgi:hypothetical protein